MTVIHDLILLTAVNNVGEPTWPSRSYGRARARHKRFKKEAYIRTVSVVGKAFCCYMNYLFCYKPKLPKL